MTAKHNKLRILFDESVPQLVAIPFENHGHEVLRHRDVLQSGVKDDVVCAAAIANHAVLIAIDRDMKQCVKRFGNPDKNGKYAKLNLIFVNCNEVLASKRVEHAMSFIEHEWQVSVLKKSRTLWLDIGPHYLRSYR